MKVCIFGAGAVGGVIAARLALGGVAETSVVARGAHLTAICERGLRLDAPEGTRIAKLRASSEPAALGPQDVVFAAVKAHDLPAIAGGLSHLLHADTTVVYAINGVPWWYFRKAGGTKDGKRIEHLDPGGALWDRIGVDRTIGCVVNMPAEVIGPGIVRYEGGSNRLAIGELGGEQSPRLLLIADMLRSGGFSIEHRKPIREEVWAKLVHKIGTSPIVILAAAPTTHVLADAGVRDAARNLYKEAFALAAAYGYAQNRDIESILNADRRGHRPSILQDLEAGRTLEIDAQLTVPIDLARDAGVPVPTLEMLTALVQARARVAGIHRG